MQATAKTAALTAAAILGIAGAVWAVPAVSNVKMEQIVDTRLVKITYDLGVEDAIVTLSIENNGVAIPDSAVTRLSGDVCKVVTNGPNKSILWNAGVDWPENVTETAKARVTAWCTNASPQVMVVDLTGGIMAENYPVSYYTSVEALPYGGLTNMIYKRSYLVMRKIDKGIFNKSSRITPPLVILTNDFYAGVFQVTQGQWDYVMNTRKSYFTDTVSWAFRPKESVSYNEIRGTEAQGGGGWPMSDNVYSNSFMGRLRTKTGLAGFDLPTDAQWEYACRAGTSTFYYDGLRTPDNIYSNAQMNVLGRYKFNGGCVWDGVEWQSAPQDCGPENGTAIVGSYLPNAWGLYDMHGNVYEWILDSYRSDGHRSMRGGCWHRDGFEGSVVYGMFFPPSAQYAFIGFRLFRTLP